MYSAKVGLEKSKGVKVESMTARTPIQRIEKNN
jgi:hypothetical protein